MGAAHLQVKAITQATKWRNTMHDVFSFPNSSLGMPVMGHLQFNQPTTSVVGFIRHQKIINRFNGLKPLKWFIGFHRSDVPRINPWAKLQPQRGDIC